MSNDYSDIIKEVKNVIAVLMPQQPFIALFLKRTWIYITKNEGIFTDGIAIYINPETWRKLKTPEKPLALAHEVMHIIQNHVPRLRKYLRNPALREIVNIVADAKVNQYLINLFINLFSSSTMKDILERIPTPDKIEKIFNISDPEKKSAEEIIEEILRKARKEGKIPVPPDFIVKIPNDLFGGDSCDNDNNDNNNDQKEGLGTRQKDDNDKKERRKPSIVEVINKGDPDEEKTDKFTERELEERIKRKTLETFMAMKVAGRGAGNMEQIIDELVKPEIDWRDILRPLLVKGLGMDIRRSWMKINIIHPDDFPGKERLKRKEVAVLIDTSGSISEEELKRFVSEVFGILRETSEVIVIQWDAKAYDPIIVKSYRDIDKIRVIYGRGGTEILPALKLVDEKYRDVDSIIIFSDWYIADLNTNEVQKLLRKYSRKILAFTTSAEPPRYLRSFKIKIST
jgi:predicted metal-dependent peptidase